MCIDAKGSYCQDAHVQLVTCCIPIAGGRVIISQSWFELARVSLRTADWKGGRAEASKLSCRRSVVTVRTERSPGQGQLASNWNKCGGLYDDGGGTGHLERGCILSGRVRCIVNVHTEIQGQGRTEDLELRWPCTLWTHLDASQNEACTDDDHPRWAPKGWRNQQQNVHERLVKDVRCYTGRGNDAQDPRRDLPSGGGHRRTAGLTAVFGARAGDGLKIPKWTGRTAEYTGAPTVGSGVPSDFAERLQPGPPPSLSSPHHSHQALSLFKMTTYQSQEDLSKYASASDASVLGPSAAPKRTFTLKSSVADSHARTVAALDAPPAPSEVNNAYVYFIGLAVCMGAVAYG